MWGQQYFQNFLQKNLEINYKWASTRFATYWDQFWTYNFEYSLVGHTSPRAHKDCAVRISPSVQKYSFPITLR